MKWLIASDIHGSALYCEQLMTAFEREKADRMLLLGDLLYHGPRNELPEGYDPKKVIDLLNEKKDLIYCVRGNCDAEVDQMVLEFPIMSDYTVICDEGLTILATHGHVFNEDKLPPLRTGDVLLHGHTHVPVCAEHDTYVHLNPGSVALPKDDSPHSYMTYEHGYFLWKDLEGNPFGEYDITYFRPSPDAPAPAQMPAFGDSFSGADIPMILQSMMAQSAAQTSEDTPTPSVPQAPEQTAQNTEDVPTAKTLSDDFHSQAVAAAMEALQAEKDSRRDAKRRMAETPAEETDASDEDKPLLSPELEAKCASALEFVQESKKKLKECGNELVLTYRLQWIDDYSAIEKIVRKIQKGRNLKKLEADLDKAIIRLQVTETNLYGK